jgi:hypothetical protein
MRKIFIIEFMWILLGILISIFLVLNLFPILNSEFLNHSINTEILINDISKILVYIIFFFIFFPVLSVIFSLKESLKKFKCNFQNQIVLFSSIISLINLSIIGYYFKSVMTFFFGSVTIYPPLSALPVYSKDYPKDYDAYIYLIYLILLINVFMIFFILKKLESK